MATTKHPNTTFQRAVVRRIKALRDLADTRIAVLETELLAASRTSSAARGAAEIITAEKPVA